MLLANAVHKLTDVGGLGLSLFAIWFGQRPAPPQKTYGYHRAEMLALSGVRDVHDFHVWTIRSGYDAMSGHIRIVLGQDRRALLEQLKSLLRRRFGIEHSTIQFEEEEIPETASHE